MEGRINWRARYGSVDTSGSLTILENTFLSRDNIYIYIYKKEKTSLVTGVSKGAAAHRWDRKMANDCREEKSYVSLDPSFLKKLSLTTVRIHDTLSFFFRTGVWSFWGRGKGKAIDIYGS